MTDLQHDEIRAFYLVLSNNKKQVFLAILANSLTVDVRGFLVDYTGTQLLRALEGANELQHQLGQHIAAIGINRDQYPDEALWNILQEKATYCGIQTTLANSLKFVRSRNTFAEQ